MAQSAVSALSKEVSSLESRLHGLESRRDLLSSTLLSSPATLQRLRRAKTQSPASQTSDLTTAFHLAERQATHNLTSLHRLALGATAFLVKDPDPRAVDEGAVLGVRIEVFSNDAFVEPYYLFLHRPYPPHPALRVHKHTIPSHVPLHELSRRYLPEPEEPDPDGQVPHPRKPQDLTGLVRALRRELVGCHKRREAAGRLKAEASACYKEMNINQEDPAFTVQFDDSNRAGSVVGFSVVYRDGTDTRIDRTDEGRVEVSIDGTVKKAVVMGDERRNARLESAVRGGDGKLTGVFQRLVEELSIVEGDDVVKATLHELLQDAGKRDGRST